MRTKSRDPKVAGSGSPTMTPGEAAAFRDRWRVANETIWDEVRAMTPEQKLLQLASLMEDSDRMGWKDVLECGVEQVRERWCRLRAASNRG